MSKKLAVSILGLLAVISYQSAQLSTAGSRVIRVIDGDTFETKDRAIIRFDTLDAPELDHCGGPEAKAALEKLILNKNVRLVSEARDVNGRQIASVYIDNTWIDEELLRTAWVIYASSTLDKDHILKNIDLDNEKGLRGVYSSKCMSYENTEDPGCVIKGNIVGEWTNKGKKLYHYPGCIQYKTTRLEKYRGEEWFCTEAEAKVAGYSKAGGCHSSYKPGK